MNEMAIDKKSPVRIAQAQLPVLDMSDTNKFGSGSSNISVKKMYLTPFLGINLNKHKKSSISKKK